MIPNYGQMVPNVRENFGGARPNFGGYVNPMNGLVCVPREMLQGTYNNNMYYGPQYRQNYPVVNDLGHGMVEAFPRQLNERNGQEEEENDPQRSGDVKSEIVSEV